MKNVLRVVLLCITMVMFVCGAAIAEDSFGAQGSALIPNLVYYNTQVHHQSTPFIILSNITDTDVQCRLTPYDDAGNDMSSMVNTLRGGTQGLWVSVAQGTGDFEIPAHSSRLVTINIGRPNTGVGYAVIEWKSNKPKMRKALIGGVTTTTTSVNGVQGQSKVLINQGNPF